MQIPVASGHEPQCHRRWACKETTQNADLQALQPPQSRARQYTLLERVSRLQSASHRSVTRRRRHRSSPLIDSPNPTMFTRRGMVSYPACMPRHFLPSRRSLVIFCISSSPIPASLDALFLDPRMWQSRLVLDPSLYIADAAADTLNIRSATLLRQYGQTAKIRPLLTHLGLIHLLQRSSGCLIHHWYIPL